jgi:ribosomal-protein-alanine N-acetyltransferase
VKEIRLRGLREGDLEAIHRIERGSYPTPWSMNFFRLMANMNPELFIVVTIEEGLVGYTVGELNESGNGGKVGHVMNVAVDSRHRNRGVGTMMMDEIEARFLRLGATAAYLEVRESNVDAQRLYRRRGYVYLRKVEGYYGDEDGLVMTKVLDR